MDAKPYFLHKHYLLFDKYGKQEAFCDECNRQIDGWAFTCEHCKFWLHGLCAGQKLESLEILSSNLDIDDSDFICAKCFTLSRGFSYVNSTLDRSWKLDIICAFSTNDQTPKEESEISKDIGKTNHHFCHDHSLTLFNYRKVRKYEYCCSWCEKPLSGMSYGCFQTKCSPPFFLHHFCFYTIPNKILQHPFHPSHPLYITRPRNFNDYPTCNACQTFMLGYHYSCAKCDFHLHALCAKLKPTLRHECHHEHYLTYFATGAITISREVSFQCQKCNSWGDKKKSAFYCCVQCNCNFHFECLIPSTIRHKYHRHPLTVMTSFREDGSGEYYCDICEKQRNPNHHVYCCTKCQYIAHIECALGKAVDAELYEGSTSSSKHEETQQKDSGFPTHLQIEHFSHEHPLIFMEVIEKYEKPLCETCEMEVCDQALKKCFSSTAPIPIPLPRFGEMMMKSRGSIGGQAVRSWPQQMEEMTIFPRGKWS
ncbi:hypothetical protein CRYUN_Cryun05aG0051800 [Craigia yunnanensis]